MKYIFWLIQLKYSSRCYHCDVCNDTKITEDGELAGDPTETALIDMGFNLDFNPALYGELPRVEEIPFDSDRKLMSTIHNIDGKYIMITKGAVDVLLDRVISIEQNGSQWNGK